MNRSDCGKVELTGHLHGWPAATGTTASKMDCFCHAPEKGAKNCYCLKHKAVGTLLNNFMYSNLELALARILGKLIVLPIEHHLSVPKPNLLLAVLSWDHQKGSRFGLHRFAGPASIACVYRTKSQGVSQLAGIAGTVMF